MEKKNSQPSARTQLESILLHKPLRQEVSKSAILSGYQYSSSAQNYGSLFQHGNWKPVILCPKRPKCGGVKRELKKLSFIFLVLFAVSFSLCENQ